MVNRLLEKSEIAGSNPTLASKFQRNNVFSRSLVKIQYCGEPPWPRGSVIGLRPPGFEFQILSLKVSLSHSSHNPQEVLLAQFSLYAHKCGLISRSFYFISSTFLIDRSSKELSDSCRFIPFRFGPKCKACPIESGAGARPSHGIPLTVSESLYLAFSVINLVVFLSWLQETGTTCCGGRDNQRRPNLTVTA